MKLTKWLAVVATTFALVACGGGGGSAGTSAFGSGSGSSSGSGSTGTGTGTGTSTAALTSLDLTTTSGTTTTSTSRISSTQTATAVATVTTSAGVPIPGLVVTFAESGPSLLKFSPVSATALTDSNGQARIDVSATSSTAVGATSLTYTVAGVTVASAPSKAFEISAGTTATVTPNAINFVSVVPSSSSIVIKGAGGAGRSESATLTFKVVDGSNAPIKGAVVNFSVNPSTGVTLNIVSATSDADGLVTTTVSSGSAPTSVVVTAVSAVNASATTQSDTLVVSNGPTLPAGFELTAVKYDLDGTITGTTTTLTAFVRDAFGNPVPQGVAVSFTTDYGSVGTATSGGCTTNDSGQCSVPFTVQNPRGTGLATVTGTIKKSDGSTISKSIFMNMSGSAGSYVARTTNTTSGVIPSSVAASTSTCKATLTLYLSDGSSTPGRAAASGTTISVVPTGAVTVQDGSPVLDVTSYPFLPAPFSLAIDATSLGCVAGGANTKAASAPYSLKFTTPGGTVFAQQLIVTYATP